MIIFSAMPRQLRRDTRLHFGGHSAEGTGAGYVVRSSVLSSRRVLICRPAQDATPDDWQSLASRAGLSTFAIAGLAARPARLFFVSVTADEIFPNPAQQAAALLQRQSESTFCTPSN